MSEHAPNKKYGPDDDFAKNRGVVKAIIQLITLDLSDYRNEQEIKHTYPVGTLS